MRWLDSITDSMDMNLRKLQERVETGKPGVLWSMGSQGVGQDFSIEQQDTDKLHTCAINTKIINKTFQ